MFTLHDNLIASNVKKAFITNSELIIDYAHTKEVIGWLDSKGHKLANWEGLISRRGGNLTVANDYSLKRYHETINDNTTIKTFLGSIDNAYRHFNNNNTDDTSALYFCITIADNIDMKNEKISITFRILSELLGILSMACWLIPPSMIIFTNGVGDLINQLYKIYTNDPKILFFVFFLFLVFPITGFSCFLLAIKGRAPVFLGDPTWISRTVLRYNIRNADGTRRWRFRQ